MKRLPYSRKTFDRLKAEAIQHWEKNIGIAEEGECGWTEDVDIYSPDCSYCIYFLYKLRSGCYICPLITCDKIRSPWDTVGNAWLSCRRKSFIKASQKLLQHIKDRTYEDAQKKYNDWLKGENHVL